MKIAVWHNLPSGGGKRVLHYQVKGLIERGHSIECWCPSLADQSYLPLSALTREHVVPFDYKPLALRGKAGRAVYRYVNAAKRLRAMEKACEQSAKEIQSGGFDILFANGCVLYRMPHILRHVQGPKLLYLQEPSRALYEANPTLPWVGRMPHDDASAIARTVQFVMDQMQLQGIRLQARREWSNAHSCDDILVNSYFSRESVLRVYGREATVCYLGIDTALFRNLRRQREGFVVGVGTFCEAKGIDRAINAIARLREPRPRLVWIGNGGMQTYLEQMRMLAKSSGVEFEAKEMIPDSELVDILNRAAVFLYTSRLEPFGLAPLEANACGTPVVAVAEGGVRESVKDGLNGLLVDSHPDALARAMSRLLSDGALRRKMGERGCEYVQREWSVEKSVDRLEESLMRAIGEQGEAKGRAQCSAL